MPPDLTPSELAKLKEAVEEADRPFGVPSVAEATRTEDRERSVVWHGDTRGMDIATFTGPNHRKDATAHLALHNAFPSLHAMAERTARVEEALADVLALIDEGWLVRETKDDGKPGWAMRQLNPIGRLAAARAAIAPTDERVKGARA